MQLPRAVGDSLVVDASLRTETMPRGGQRGVADLVAARSDAGERAADRISAPVGMRQMLDNPSRLGIGRAVDERRIPERIATEGMDRLAPNPEE